MPSGDSRLDIYSWFADSPVKDGLGLWELGPGLLLLAVLLGYCIFTDLKGSVIPNRITIPLWLAAVAIAPLIYPHPATALAVGAAGTAVFFAMGLFYSRGFGLGDAKLLAGLSFLFGQAVLGILFLGSLIALVYALPLVYLAQRARRRGEEVGKLRKLKLQFGPALALASVVPVWVSGAGAWALAYLGVMLLTVVAAALAVRYLKPRIEQAERELLEEESTEVVAADEPARLRRQLTELDAWAARMPDAGFDESDPRWAWWHERPRLEGPEPPAKTNG